MISATGPFPRGERIRRSSEFKALSRRSERRQGRCFVILSAPREAAEARARLGVTVSRRVGNAVVRNRVKRRIREWFRTVGRQEMAGRDVVVIARSAAADLDGRETFRELSGLARDVGSLERPR